MISREKCIMLGTLVKTHGVHGSLLLRVQGFEDHEIKGPGSVFIETNGLLVPFFMSDIKQKSGDEFIIYLDDVDTPEKAEQLKGHKVFIEIAQLSKKKPLHAERDIKGYTVTDRNSGFTGKASEVVNMAGTMLLKVLKDDGEFLIPFHEDIIRKINHREKTIIIDAPEGLFEL